MITSRKIAQFWIHKTAGIQKMFSNGESVMVEYDFFNDFIELELAGIFLLLPLMLCLQNYVNTLIAPICSRSYLRTYGTP